MRPLYRLVPLVTLALTLSACATSATGPAPGPTALPRPPRPSVTPVQGRVYAALGASETYGVGAEPHTRGYAYIVARELHARHFVDAGIPGATLSSGYQTELTVALDARPSLCTVFFGVNDLRAGITRDAFLADLHDLVATLRRAHAEVLIIGMPDLSLVPAASALPDARAISASWNQGMATVAAQTGAHFLDLRAYDQELAAHPNYVAADGLHPSDAGHARLAQVVVSAIEHGGLWRP